MEIILNGLTKEYKGCRAVDGVSMRIGSPLIYGLIGKNGAGKTTLLKMIAGLTAPTSGRVEYDAPNGIGTLIEAPGIFGHLCARDNLLIKMKMTGDDDRSHADELLKKVGLENAGKKKAASFSLGMKQRLGVALALVGDPDILLLDEPINGLDPEGIALIRDLLIEQRNKNKIIIVSSHMLEELSKVCDRYGILDKGVLIKEFCEGELEFDGSDTFVVRVDDTERTSNILSALGVNHSLKGQTVLITEPENRVGAAISKLFEEGVRVREFKRYENALERVLLEKGGEKR